MIVVRAFGNYRRARVLEKSGSRYWICYFRSPGEPWAELVAGKEVEGGGLELVHPRKITASALSAPSEFLCAKALASAKEHAAAQKRYAKLAKQIKAEHDPKVEAAREACNKDYAERRVAGEKLSDFYGYIELESYKAYRALADERSEKLREARLEAREWAAHRQWLGPALEVAS